MCMFHDPGRARLFTQGAAPEEAEAEAALAKPEVRARTRVCVRE